MARMQRQRLRRHLLVRRGLLYSLLLAFAILLLGGVGFWVLEPTVTTLHEGLWLAFTTAATVGYGDVVPTSAVSRAFSVVVVLLGLAVLSLVTASLAAIFVEQDVEAEEKQIEIETLRELAQLRHQMQVMRAMLEHMQAGVRQSALYREEPPEPPSPPQERAQERAQEQAPTAVTHHGP